MKIQLQLKQKVKLSSLLAGLVAASVLLTVAILLFASQKSEKDSLVETTLSLNYSLSAKMSNNVDSLFQAMRSSLHGTSQFLNEHEAFTDNDLQSHIELIQGTNRYFNSLFWADETGIIRAIAPDTVGMQGAKLSTESAVLALNAQAPFLSSPYIGATGRLILLISEPCFDTDGQYRGIVGGTIYLQENNILNEILGQHATDEFSSYYYVVDSHGKLLYHPDTSRLGEDVSVNPAVHKLMNGENGTG